MDNLLEKLKNHCQLSRVLVNMATILGIILISICFIKLLVEIYKGFRLYIWSQICSKTNLRKRYGEWVVISGATDGIGLSMAREFARRGFSLIIIGRNDEKLLRTKLSLEEEENVGQVITVKIDLADSSLENFARIRTEIDPENRDIGILVNNAGIMSTKASRFGHSDMITLRNMANINMLATVYLTRMILPGMVERGKGLVLNTSSLLGDIPYVYGSIYGPTKAFVNAFSRTLQIEYSSHPIDIILLTPGAVRTNLFHGVSNIKKSSFLIPTAEEYAKSSLNAICTRQQSLSGNWFHGLYGIGGRFGNSLGLTPIFTKMLLRLFAKDFTLSPVMRRKGGMELI